MSDPTPAAPLPGEIKTALSDYDNARDRLEYTDADDTDAITAAMRHVDERQNALRLAITTALAAARREGVEVGSHLYAEHRLSLEADAERRGAERGAAEVERLRAELDV